MPRPENLRLHLKLLSDLDQLAARLEAGDQSAVAEAQDRLYGVALCNDPITLALVMKALAKVLADFQQEIDAGGWRFD